MAKTEKLSDAVNWASLPNDRPVMYAATRDHVAVAVSRWRKRFRQTEDKFQTDDIVAIGVVHFDRDVGGLITAQVEIHRSAGISRCSLTYLGIDETEKRKIQLSVHLFDPTGELTDAAERAFSAAAENGDRFVYLHFKKTSLDGDQLIKEFKERGYASSMLISETSVALSQTFRRTPDWGWQWEDDDSTPSTDIMSRLKDRLKPINRRYLISVIWRSIVALLLLAALFSAEDNGEHPLVALALFAGWLILSAHAWLRYEAVIRQLASAAVVQTYS